MQCVYDNIIICVDPSHFIVGLEQGWQSVLRKCTSKSKTISRGKNNMPPTFEGASHKVKKHQHTCIENYWDSLPSQLSLSFWRESLLWGEPATLHCNCSRWTPFIVPQWQCCLCGQKRIYWALILHNYLRDFPKYHTFNDMWPSDE